jgi:trehalose utilization protein
MSTSTSSSPPIGGGVFKSGLTYDLAKNHVILFQNESSPSYFGEANKNTPLAVVLNQRVRE